MDKELKKAVKAHLGPQVTHIGFAPVERFDKAPDRHHPARACKDAQTVVVFGISVPQGMLRSPDYSLYFLHRTYHTVYRRLDELALDLCNFIEARAGHLAVPVPSFAPLVYHGLEPWGIISLKHAGVNAGLGALGRNGLLFHPTEGALLRLGGVITSAPIPGDPLISDAPCTPACTACQEVCPSKALGNGGAFDKLVCMGHTIKHAIYPLTLKDEAGLKHIERIINTAGYDYWLTCNECLKVCPNNSPKGGRYFKNK